MGIGFALASGLVQGFTQNIGREMEKRAGEVDRINKLRDAILLSSVGDNFNNANVAAIQNMISSSEEQIQARGGIDIFGTRSDDILGDDEMTQLLGSLQSTAETDEDEKFYLGGYLLDKEIETTPAGSYELLRNWTRIMSDDANVDLLRTKTPDELNDIHAAIISARRIITQDELDTKNPGVAKAPNLYGTGTNAMFPGIENWDNFAEGYYTTDTEAKGVSGWTKPDMDSITVKLTEQGVEFASIGEGKIGADGNIDYQYLDLTGLPAMQQAHDELAAMLGLNEEQRPALLNYWQRAFMKVPGDAEQMGIYTANALEGALEFAISMGGVEKANAIKPSMIKGSLAGNDGGVFAKLMHNALNNATIENGSDLRSRVYALAAVLPAPKQKRPATTVGDMITIEPQTVQMYILQKIFGPDSKDIKFKEFIDGQNDLKVAVDDLKRLQTEFLKMVESAERGADGKLTADAANLAYEQFKKELKVVFDVDQGILGGLLRDVTSVIKSRPDQDRQAMLNDDENLTQEYLDMLQQGVSDKKDVRMARLEAMRISLAFRMARAADPSGRLSNQDIEIQLRKLGTNFSTIEQATGALKEAIYEFETKQEQYAVFAQYAADDYLATPEDLKVVDAALMVDELDRGIRAFGRQGSAADAAATPPTPDISNVVKIGGRYIDQSTGNTITDQTIIDAYEAAQGNI